MESLCDRCGSARRVVELAALSGRNSLCSRHRRCRQCRHTIHGADPCVRGDGTTADDIFHVACAESCPACHAPSCEADLVYLNGGSVLCSRHCHHCHALDPAGAVRRDDLVFCPACARHAGTHGCDLCAEWRRLEEINVR
jgi:hypothetical protein